MCLVLTTPPPTHTHTINTVTAVQLEETILITQFVKGIKKRSGDYFLIL